MILKAYKFFFAACFAIVLPCSAFAQCDETIGYILQQHLKPAVESIDCAILKGAGIDKERHRLGEVCYESFGATAHLRIGAHLKCKSGGLIPASISENVKIEFDINGKDCSTSNPKVSPSGELAKALAEIAGANGKLKKAVEDALVQICKK